MSIYYDIDNKLIKSKPREIKNKQIIEIIENIVGKIPITIQRNPELGNTIEIISPQLTIAQQNQLKILLDAL